MTSCSDLLRTLLWTWWWHAGNGNSPPSFHVQPLTGRSVTSIIYWSQNWRWKSQTCYEKVKIYVCEKTLHKKFRLVFVWLKLIQFLLTLPLLFPKSGNYLQTRFWLHWSWSDPSGPRKCGVGVVGDGEGCNDDVGNDGAVLIRQQVHVGGYTLIRIVQVLFVWNMVAILHEKKLFYSYKIFSYVRELDRHEFAMYIFLISEVYIKLTKNIK